jgi:thiamine-monophosphate kinase
LNEFELIARYFADTRVRRDDVVMGIGDDAAIVQPPPGTQLVISTDTLVEGIHFPRDTPPADVGHKALAVNLSDLAAMGADPAWFTLNLTLPQPDAAWLHAFAAGLFALARRFHIQLVGGDTTRGPLSISITVHGFVPTGTALRRRGAQPGDGIYVSGALGDAALGLRLIQGQLTLPDEYHAPVLERLNRPVPRVEAGRALRGLASSCIDVSDGLLADLGHILEASDVGATLDLKRIPVSPAYDCVFADLGWEPALTGGDDYELCFTLPPAHEREFKSHAPSQPGGFSLIGEIEAAPGLRVQDESGQVRVIDARGYDHFRTP